MRARPLAAAVFLLASAASAAGACRARQPALLAVERARHPASEPQDYYKALYQACMGPEHDLGGRASARARLASELASLGPARPGEPLVEPLPLDASPATYARVNLRPFRDRALPLDALLDAMFAARPAGEPGARCLRRAWRASVPALGAAGRSLDAALAPQGYPAVHHTPSYRAQHAPAYRVAPLDALRARGIE